MTPYYATAPLGQAVIPPGGASVTASGPGGTITYPPQSMTLYSMAGTAAAAALAWHGYKRNGSIGWALAWAVFGGAVWPVALGIAYAQGFGKPAHMRANRGRRRRNRS